MNHRVDDELMFVRVLGRSRERGRVGARSRERSRRNGRAGLADQELGAGADVATIGVHDASRLRTAQEREDGRNVERAVGVDADGAREHDLFERPPCDARERTFDHGPPLGVGGRRRDAELRRLGLA